MGDRDQNVGRLDRILRVPFGLAAAVVAFNVNIGIFVVVPVALLAAILLISAITGTCGIYAVFGINTCGDEVCTEDGVDEEWVAE